MTSRELDNQSPVGPHPIQAANVIDAFQQAIIANAFRPVERRFPTGLGKPKDLTREVKTTPAPTPKPPSFVSEIKDLRTTGVVILRPTQGPLRPFTDRRRP